MVTQDYIRRGFEHVLTERLILRMPISDDVQDVFAIHADSETNRFNPHGPMKTTDEASKRLQEWQHYWERDGFGYWSVLRQDSPVIGFGGVRRMRWAEREVLNLYYRFSTSTWGQGYATELARTALQLSQKYLPELPVVARISPNNKPSISVAQRVGMVLKQDISDDEFSVYVLRWDGD